MTLARYPSMSSWMNPMAEMMRMKQNMEKLFSAFPARGWAASFDAGSGVFPALNVNEDGEKVYVEAELPGIGAEDLDISVVGNTLTLKGERKPDAVENVSYHRRERQTGKFHKSLTLPYDVDADKVEAHCKDGVLRLTLPKAEHAKPKKITVNG